MARGSVSKVDILSRLYKLKTSLYHVTDYSEEKRSGAHEALNKVIDMINEYER